MIDKLQAILLLIASELIVIHDAPRKSSDHINPVLMNSLQHLTKIIKIIACPFKVVSLAVYCLGVLHEWIEAGFRYCNARGPKGIPYCSLDAAGYTEV